MAWFRALVPTLCVALVDAGLQMSGITNIWISASLWALALGLLIYMTWPLFKGWRIRSPVVWQSVSLTQADTKLAALPLTEDQKQFRVGLKHFCLTYPERLQNDLGRVRAVLVNHIKGLGDEDYSYALFHAIHFGWSSGSRVIPAMANEANLSLHTMDVILLQKLLNDYFSEYQWDQRSIANLNVLAKLDLTNSPATQKWLATDKECLAELDKLKVWPEATKNLKIISADNMAISEVNWTEPFRVNF